MSGSPYLQRPARTEEQVRDARIAEHKRRMAWRAEHPDPEHEHLLRLAREGREI